MLSSGFHGFDRASLTTVLSACDGLDFLGVTQMVHGLVVLRGYERETAVGNALITAYFKCGCFVSGKRAFDEMMERNVISWTAVVSGLVQNEFFEDSLSLFKEMCCGPVLPNILTYLSALSACAGSQSLQRGCQIHGLLWKLGIQSNYRIETALMDMYSKCGNVQDAWQIFESAEMTDEISMTVLLLGFAQNGFEDEAIQIFLAMVKAGSEIDPDVVSAVLGVFGADTSLDLESFWC
ncbi:OLC1v1000455C1 [Oldenlandia corymbosa var. corymbosa]|uniref:OLC1v1000455C1 n=1 Tax=Oldenlandia corymbosa var. corymbosa TaxID=529605 RepID=A0AAV1D6E7_OLDCO|nr:OLC1v1000455C1 [Oldenlandia corymbosa var. corymbosa]